MTSISSEQKDKVTQESNDLESSIRPESFANQMQEKIQSDVVAFQADVLGRIAEAKVVEGGLDAQTVERIRTDAGVRELPDLLNKAHALADAATKSIQLAAKPQMSDRFRRAVYGEVKDVEIQPAVVREHLNTPVQSVETKDVEMQKEAHIPMEVFRLKRDLALATATEKLDHGERLEQVEVEMLVGAAEGRGWQKLISRVEAGDTLVSFLVPNEKHFSIKYFNDVLFGMQKTDDIIKIRRDILARKSVELGLERVATSHKDECHRISKERVEEKGEAIVAKELSDAAEYIRVEMTSELTEMSALEWSQADEKRKTTLDEFVRHLLGEKAFAQYEEQRVVFLASYQAWQESVAKEAQASRNRFTVSASDLDADTVRAEYEHARELARAAQVLMQQARYGMRAEVVSPALRESARRGYRMTFGTSDVEESPKGDYTNIERAVSYSLKGAMIARDKSESGSAFSKEEERAVVDRVIKLRDRIGLQDLTDEQGRVYPIFEIRPDGKAKSVHIINLDLVREIRKGSFKPVSDAKQFQLFEDVKAYINAINIFDVTKPYIHTELSGALVYGTNQTIEQQTNRTGELTARLREGSATIEERHELALLLKQDGKDRACSSTMEFHRKALEISNCSYISLDVLDVGPELLQEYELLLQRVANDRMSFDEAQLIAGDATTEKMRLFRAQVTEAYRHLCHNEEPIISVGGDELVLAMDTAKVTDEFMLQLRQIKLSDREGGSVRVVKTAVGTGERVSDASGDVRMKEHLEAMKRAERGTTIAKELEKTIREIRTTIYDLPRADRDAYFEALSRLNIDTFAVHQREEGDMSFELILRDPEDEYGAIRANLEGKKQELDDLLARLHRTVDERRHTFYLEQVPTHAKLTKEMVPIALRRLDQSPKGFEMLMKAFE